MNRTLIAKVRDKLVEDRQQHDQSIWLDFALDGERGPDGHIVTTDRQEVIADCNTRACAAGWAVLLDDRATLTFRSNGEKSIELTGWNDRQLVAGTELTMGSASNISWADAGAFALELDNETAGRLFEENHSTEAVIAALEALLALPEDARAFQEYDAVDETYATYAAAEAAGEEED